jgi:hypothetical protein
MRLTKGRWVVYVLFAMAVVAVLRFMDRSAYGRAQRLYGQARQVAVSGEGAPGFNVRRAGDAVVVAASGVQADVCNAFTGGLWFGFLMPRLASVRHLHPNVRSLSGYCDRAGPNTLLFRFEGAGVGSGGGERGSTGGGGLAAARNDGNATVSRPVIAGARLSGGLRSA